MNAQTTHDWFPYEPTEVPRPGETLIETLEELGMSQSKLATRTGLTLKHINQIVKGHASISPATAVALERATGVPASLWNGLEADFQDFEARNNEAEELAKQAAWLERMPVSELRKRGFVTADKRNPGRLLQEVLNFFGVGSVAAWEASWDQPAAAFLQSTAYEVDPGAVAAWLRLGEMHALSIAKEVDFQPFDKAALKALLPTLREMTLHEPREFYPRLVEECARIGVCIAVVPDVGGTRAFGASRFTSPNRAVVQLSNRGKRNDKFWFALFHELGHLILHSKKETFMRFDDPGSGGAEASIEEQANEFAGRLLIPAEAESELRDVKTPADAKVLAKSLGIAPGIVAGRIQHDRQDWRFGQSLFEKYEIRDASSD